MAQRTLPPEFEQMLRSDQSGQLSGLVEALSSTEPSVAIRHNGLRRLAPADDARKVAWWPRGEHLDSPRRFTFDVAMHQGLYYVQDASSMFAGYAVSRLIEEIPSLAGRPLTMLDACAAPGGKTACALEALPEGSVVVANEMSPQRVSVLAEVMAKHGSPSTIITRDDAARLGARLPGCFDIAIVDAPCSGEGMMRKEPVAISQWSRALVAECAAAQRSILEGVWKSLKPGGVLIYSTCTFNLLENERQVEWLVDRFGAEPIDLAPDASWGIAGAIDSAVPACRFIPGRIEGEGLFMAAVRKPGELIESKEAAPSRGRRRDRRSDGRQQGDAAAAKAAGSWIADAAAYDFLEGAEPGSIRAVPKRARALFDLVASVSRPVAAGIELATAKGRGFAPTQQLALSTALRSDAFERCEIADEAAAMSYLRREAPVLPGNTPRGFVLLTHKSVPLGFVNNLGSRANNLYPANWRILSSRF